MIQFLYALGSIVYDVLTIWLAFLGVIMVWGFFVGGLNYLTGNRKRFRSDLHGEHLLTATIFTAFALAAGTVDHYILTPALGAGINFFFAG